MEAAAATHSAPAVVLRDYQAGACAAILTAFERGENPVASLPTGSGKSLVIAAVVERLRGRIVITVPSRELAEQDEGALQRLLPASDVGVVCAALGRRELDRRVIVGTPQSLTGAIDFSPAAVIVDEAHQMPLHHGSWFARLFDGLPEGRATRRIGLSATTFRTAAGAIFGQPTSWFSCQPFEISVAELVAREHLAPVRYVAPAVLMTTKGVSRSAGDYAQGPLARANLGQVAQQVRVIVDAMVGRRKGLIFGVTVEHARAYVDALRAAGERCVLIVGDMAAADRRRAVADFKGDRAKYAATVAAALTGFNVPDLDLVASCRPTLSPIVHVQSIGRGTRPAPAKADCLVLDFAGNIPRFGPVAFPHFDPHGQPLGGVAPWRPCEACATYNHFSAEACSHCARPLIVRRQVTAEALEFGTIDFRREVSAIERLVAERGTTGLPVESIALHAYRKRADPNSVSVMISLGLGGEAIVRIWAKRLDSPRWRDLWESLLGDLPAPRTLREAHGRRGELLRPAAVSIEREDAFWRVRRVDYGSDEAEAA